MQLIIVSPDAGMMQMEEQIGQILMVKSFLESAPDLHRALGSAQSALLIKIRDLCRPEVTVPILAGIRTVIEADVTYMKSPLDLRNQRTFAVKAGISGMLDVARQTYKELTEEIHQHVDELNGSCFCKNATPGTRLTWAQSNTGCVPLSSSTMAESTGFASKRPTSTQPPRLLFSSIWSARRKISNARRLISSS